MYSLTVRGVRCLVSRCMHTSTSIDPQEIEKFSALASQWWHPNGPFAALHHMNSIRVPLIREVAMDNLCYYRPAHHVRVLSGLKILDVGCGGGILSEPLARLGARVTGVDASATNVGVAEQHASADGDLSGRLTYRCCTVEDLVQEQEQGEDNQFDIVVASEVIEHVAEPRAFVGTCKRLARPGGALIFTTINRTGLSYASAIVAAESILGLVPPGTHEWRKFVTPNELSDMLQSGSPASVKSVNGLFYNILTKRWTKTPCSDVNYFLVAVQQEIGNTSPKSVDSNSDINTTHTSTQQAV